MKSFTQTAGHGAMLLALMAALASGCGKKSESNVLARVGGQVITVDDFKAEVQRRTANRQPLPDRQTLLEEMITRATLMEHARAAGLENAADVQRAMGDVLIAKLTKTELEPKLDAVKISPEEIRTAYEQNAARFTQPAKAHLAIIFLAADAKTDTNRLTEITSRANEAHELAQALPGTEKSFGKVAAEFSEDQVSRYRGGDAGWFTGNILLGGRWPKEVVTTGLALKSNGDLSGILHLPDGFYLVKKMDTRPAMVAPLASVRGGIEHRLLIAKRQSVEADFKSSLRTAAQVQTDSELLGRLDYPTSAIAQANSPATLALPASP